MSPQDFKLARGEGKTRVMVDGYPYLATTRVSLTKNDPQDKLVATLGSMLDLMFQQAFDHSKMMVTHVSGGLTNTLFKVSGLNHQATSAVGSTTTDNNKNNNNNNNKVTLFQSDDQAVLVRLFGAEGMIDRDVESNIFRELAKAGLAPPFYGAFVNGRLEGWKEGMRHLAPRELALPNVRCHIAQAMATLHYQFRTATTTTSSSGSDDDDDGKEEEEMPNLWTQINEWYMQALNNSYQTKEDSERVADLQLHRIQEELDWLQSEIIPSQAATGFCHNDVLAANVLYDENTGKVQLIDFEYGGCNYNAFDIANHWNEYAGGPPVSAVPRYEWFPSTYEQEQFVQAYIDTVHKIAPPKLRLDMTDFLQEIHGFVMINHFYWGLWSVNQAANEGCQNFDYITYAMHRLDQYHVCKEDMLMRTNSSDSSEHKSA